MMKIIKFFKTFFIDGYSIVGLIAPIISIVFTICKALEFPMGFLKEVSYSWGCLPLLMWTFVAYSRRYIEFTKIKSSPSKERTTYITNIYSDNRQVENTFIKFNPKDNTSIIKSNNVDSLTDVGHGEFIISFCNEIDYEYEVRIVPENEYKYKIKSRKPEGFHAVFDEHNEPDEEITLFISKVS